MEDYFRRRSASTGWIAQTTGGRGGVTCRCGRDWRQDLAAGLPVYLGPVAVYDDLAARRSVSQTAFSESPPNSHLAWERCARGAVCGPRHRRNPPGETP